MLSQVSESDSGKLGLVLQDGGGRLGNEDLSAVTDSGDSRRAMDREADIAFGVELSFAGVDAHADAYRGAVRPRMAS